MDRLDIRVHPTPVFHHRLAWMSFAGPGFTVCPEADNISLKLVFDHPVIGDGSVGCTKSMAE